MIPGEILPLDGDIELNAGLDADRLRVANTGDRPIQVGSHYHFAETNPALLFDRAAGARQAARHRGGNGGALRAGTGARGDADPVARRRIVQGFRGEIMGGLD